MKRSVALGFFALVMSAAVGRAEVWHSNGGEVEGKLTAVYGPLALIAHPNGSSLLPVDSLDPTELDRVADFLEKRPKRVAWKSSRSKLADAVDGHLEILRDNKLVPFDPGTRIEPEFYLIYFGAGWCGPCRRFSPGFVQTYGKLKQAIGDRFEVIFVTWDQSEWEQLDYVREAHMPWPVLEFRLARTVEPISRWEGDGIPCLVLLTPNGDLIYHSYQGSEYLGPESVITRFAELLKATDPTSHAAKKALYPLALREHERKAAGKSAPPVPYFVSLDPQQYQTMEVRSLKATLQLNDRGEVTDASFEPEPPPAIEAGLISDAEKWIFLPAIKDGKPVPMKVTFPIHVGK